jgi:putative ABC transport system ATP-binding protein
MSNAQPIIEMRGIGKTIDSGSHVVEILRDIDFAVPRGQFVAIMGPSGSGKSTLLGLLGGLDTPSTGTLLFEGDEIQDLDEDAMALLRGRKIGFIFQSCQLVPTLTAEENVLLPLELAGNGRFDAQRFDARRAAELLDQVGLADRRDHYPVQLSGGEQQRVALARAFVNSPPLVLADEPTGNLDSVNGRHVLEMLTELNRQQGTTLVLVTHNRELAHQAGRLICLRDGRIVSDESR